MTTIVSKHYIELSLHVWRERSNLVNAGFVKIKLLVWFNCSCLGNIIIQYDTANCTDETRPKRRREEPSEPFCQQSCKKNAVRSSVPQRALQDHCSESDQSSAMPWMLLSTHLDFTLYAENMALALSLILQPASIGGTGIPPD